MIIIFDSIEQKNTFLKEIAEDGNTDLCPGNFGLKEYCDGYTKPISCRDCWELAAELTVGGKNK